MAFEVTVDINDNQQARILALATRYAPEASLPQLRARLEKAALRGIRKEIQEWIAKVTDDDWSAARDTEDTAFQTDFPDPDPIDEPLPDDPIE